MTETQASRLLPALFEKVDPDKVLTVLNIGPALPETVAFFCSFRCKLHITDLYSELPLVINEDEEKEDADLGKRLEEELQLPPGVQFDLIFFWDVLNFLSSGAIEALANTLRPHLHQASRAHCFAVHNAQTPAAGEYYGIADQHHLSVRERVRTPPDYQPHPQGELVSLLRYFAVDRSILMHDQRIELLLKARF